MIYERKRGMRYLIEAGYSRLTGMGDRDIKPSLIAEFKPISDNNQMGVCDTRRTAEQYVAIEVASGKLAPSSRDKRVVDVDNRLQRAIEMHPDYEREGGLGLIRRQKTKEQRAAELRQHAQAMIDKAAELEKSVDTMSEEELEKATAPEKKSDGIKTENQRQPEVENSLDKKWQDYAKNIRERLSKAKNQKEIDIILADGDMNGLREYSPVAYDYLQSRGIDRLAEFAATP